MTWDCTSIGIRCLILLFNKFLEPDTCTTVALTLPSTPLWWSISTELSSFWSKTTSPIIISASPLLHVLTAFHLRKTDQIILSPPFSELVPQMFLVPRSSSQGFVSANNFELAVVGCRLKVSTIDQMWGCQRKIDPIQIVIDVSQRSCVYDGFNFY